VYGIVSQNGGFIDVASTPGRGTVMALHLPRYAGGALPEVAGQSSPAVVGGMETILLVEDQPAMLTVTARSLERLGYTVIAAGSPAEAISQVRERPGEIHLLVADVVMPAMNGRDLAARLGELRPGLRCLFISGFTADVADRHGISGPGMHVLAKPFAAGALAAKVREVLDGQP
ncbi:MAG: response regulator, partial [Chloroflexota bacterium]